MKSETKLTLFGGLNPREALFVHEYTQDWRRRDAALRAGYSRGFAAEAAARILRKPEAQKLIDDLIDMRCERIQVNMDWVLQELIKLYQADLSEVVRVSDYTGKPYYDFSDASPSLMSAIEALQIKPTKEGVDVKVTLPNKRELLKLIGSHISVGAFKDQVEHIGVLKLFFDKQDEEA